MLSVFVHHHCNLKITVSTVERFLWPSSLSHDCPWAPHLKHCNKPEFVMLLDSSRKCCLRHYCPCVFLSFEDFASVCVHGSLFFSNVDDTNADDKSRPEHSSRQMTFQLDEGRSVEDLSWHSCRHDSLRPMKCNIEKIITRWCAGFCFISGNYIWSFP